MRGPAFDPDPAMAEVSRLRKRVKQLEARERKLREALERIANDATPMGFKVIAREALRSLDSEGGG